MRIIHNDEMGKSISNHLMTVDVSIVFEL